MIAFGSLFAGIGGFDLGFERAGMTCKWQVEIDDYATRVLEKRWPDVQRWRDVRDFPPEPANEWYVDVVCGGFPCQDISYAGRGAGLAGERSGLFFEAVRVVRELQPRVVVLENVAALLSRGLDRVCGELAEIGYDTEWHCIPAAAVGAPHIRDRVFVLAYRDSQPTSTVNAKVAIMSGSVSDAKSNGRGQGRPWGTVAQSEVWESEGAIERNEWWAIEPQLGRVAHGIPSRMDRLRGLGNAVVPQVAEWIGLQVSAALDDWNQT